MNFLPVKKKDTSSALKLLRQFRKVRPGATLSGFIKNYLIVLNSIRVTLTRQKDRFKNYSYYQPVFALGYIEDISSRKIYYLEGNRGSKLISIYELQKDTPRYDLTNIIVNQDCQIKMEVAYFFQWLKDITEELLSAETLQHETINPKSRPGH